VKENGRGNQEWTIQRHWQHWEHKTQDKDNPETLATIKNGQSRDTDNNQEWTIQSISNIVEFYRGCHGRDRMVVGFTTTCAISVYHH
jgi:hypothetical protein